MVIIMTQFKYSESLISFMRVCLYHCEIKSQSTCMGQDASILYSVCYIPIFCKLDGVSV